MPKRIQIAPHLSVDELEQHYGQSSGVGALGFSSLIASARKANMNSDFNELLPVVQDERAQIGIIGTRDQVIHQINEFYVKNRTPRIA